MEGIGKIINIMTRSLPYERNANEEINGESHGQDVQAR